jgi:hypothetical protein
VTTPHFVVSEHIKVPYGAAAWLVPVKTPADVDVATVLVDYERFVIAELSRQGVFEDTVSLGVWVRGVNLYNGGPSKTIIRVTYTKLDEYMFTNFTQEIIS